METVRRTRSDTQGADARRPDRGRAQRLPRARLPRGDARRDRRAGRLHEGRRLLELRRQGRSLPRAARRALRAARRGLRDVSSPVEEEAEETYRADRARDARRLRARARVVAARLGLRDPRDATPGAARAAPRDARGVPGRARAIIEALCERHGMRVSSLPAREIARGTGALMRGMARRVGDRPERELPAQIFERDARRVPAGTRRPAAREEHRMTAAVTQPTLDPAALRARAGEILARDRWSREQLLELQQRPPARVARARGRALALLPRGARRRRAPSASLAELPTLPKPLLMEEFDRIVTDPRAAARRPARRFSPTPSPARRTAASTASSRPRARPGSPGCSSTRTRSSRTGSPSASRAFARAGVTPETRLIAIGAPSDLHITRQLFAAFQAGREGVPRLSVTTPLAEMVDALNGYQPEALLAYASVVGSPGRRAARRSAARSSRDLIVTTSEVLTDETERRIEAAWGRRPVNAYAATEAPGIAIGSRRPRRHARLRGLARARGRRRRRQAGAAGRARQPGSCSRTSSTARSR